ncbi:hypothetical protein FRB95_001581 [Tulasnella sp. JGI-2019a]|nr:hypothetical protein FRB95_001581 [Tulasnella sp. JGI-2019a]
MTNVDLIAWNSSQIVYTNGTFSLSWSDYAQQMCPDNEVSACGGFQPLCNRRDSATLLFTGDFITVNLARYGYKTNVTLFLDGLLWRYLDATLPNYANGATPYDAVDCSLASATKTGLATNQTHNVTIGRYSSDGFNAFLLQSFQVSQQSISSTTGTPTTSQTSSSSSSTATSTSSANSSSSPSTATWIAIGVCGGLFIAFVLAMTWILVRKNKSRRRYQGSGVLDDELENIPMQAPRSPGGTEATSMISRASSIAERPVTASPLIAESRLPDAQWTSWLQPITIPQRDHDNSSSHNLIPPRGQDHPSPHDLIPPRDQDHPSPHNLIPPRDQDHSSPHDLIPPRGHDHQNPHNLIPPAALPSKVIPVFGSNPPAFESTPPLYSPNAPSSSSLVDRSNVIQRLVDHGVPVPQVASFIALVNNESGNRGESSAPAGAGNSNRASEALPPQYEPRKDGRGGGPST